MTLTVENLAVSYGATRAVRDVSLEVLPGEIVAVLGANGAGKTTLLSTLAGLLHPDEGTVRFDDHDITGASPERVVKSGISLTPEGRHVFAGLTVSENLRLGRAIRKDKAASLVDQEWVLGLFPRLTERLDTPAGKLSGGEQQMLAIGRSLLSKPKLLMIDEPSLGLAPLIVDQIFELFEDLRQKGFMILLVEQDAHRALEIADRAYVMQTGTVQYEGTAADLLDTDLLVAAYLGGDQIDDHDAVVGEAEPPATTPSEGEQ